MTLEWSQRAVESKVLPLDEIHLAAEEASWIQSGPRGCPKSQRGAIEKSGPGLTSSICNQDIQFESLNIH